MKGLVTTAVFLLLLGLCRAQTIQVDITPAHSTNRFVPNQALGAGIDRIPGEAIDKGLALLCGMAAGENTIPM